MQRSFRVCPWLALRRRGLCGLVWALFSLQAACDSTGPGGDLMQRFRAKLAQEELELRDLPTNPDTLGELFRELGFTSALEQTKLRKVVREVAEREAQKATTAAAASKQPSAVHQLHPPKQAVPHPSPPLHKHKPTPKPKDKLAHHKKAGHAKRQAPISPPDGPPPVYICDTGNDESLRGIYEPFAGRLPAEDDLGVPRTSDGVPVYAGDHDRSIYRLNGYWYLGYMHGWPPESAWSCRRDCGAAHQESPPLGVRFKVADRDLAHGQGPILSNISCEAISAAAAAAARAATEKVARGGAEHEAETVEL